MKVVTWNINGIRASNREIPLKKLLDSLEADVICLQETKVTRDQLDEATAIVDGYTAFFSFSKVKGGYSGVATYCKASCTPKAVEEGLTGFLTDDSNKTSIKCYANEALSLTTTELASLDGEGRAIMSEHEVLGCKSVVIVNLYCPRADRDNDERWTYKQNFYSLVQARCDELISFGKNVMIVGDLNVSHTKLDHCDPDADPEYFASNESRIWMSSFLLPLSKMKNSNELTSSQMDNETINKIDENTDTQSSVTDTAESLDESCIQPSVNEDSKNSSICTRKTFVDVFRYFYPKRENAFTCWSTLTSARKTNYGTRIDYILADKEFLLKYAVSCDIRPDIHGSDHCPVEATFSCEINPSAVIPDICSVYMPEFKGKQKSIKAFLQAGGAKPDAFRLQTNEATANKSMFSKNSCQETTEKSKNLKRKAETELTKNQTKLQRKGSVGQTNGKKTGSNFLSYFQKKSQEKPNEAKNETLKNFLKDAQITDSKLQEEIFRDFNVASKEDKDLSSSSESISSSQEPVNETASSSEQECLTIVPPETAVARDKDNNTSASTTKETIDNVNRQDKDQPSVKSEGSKSKWKNILKGPDPPPLCEGHKEECVLRTVKKQGANLGKQFYCCARPEGRANDKEARCKTFLWKKK